MSVVQIISKSVFSKGFILIGLLTLFWMTPQTTIQAVPSFTPPTLWPQVLKLYKQRAWKQVVLVLTPIISTHFPNREDALRARFILGQSYLALKQYPLAQKHFSYFLNEGQEYRDIGVYHLMRVYLLSEQERNAIPLIKELLNNSAHPFYRKKIRANIKGYFNTDKTAPLIYPVLHSSRKQPSLLLNNHHIIEIYKKGAQLSKQPFSLSWNITQWLHPDSLKTAKISDKTIDQMIKKKQKKPTSAQYLQRYKALKKLRLYQYLIQIIPKQIDRVKNNYTRTLIANIYLSSLFKQKHYSRIIHLRNQNILTKKYKALKTTQLFWSMRAHHRRKNLKKALSELQRLKKGYPKSTWLPSAYLKTAEYYQIIKNDKKAVVWWKRLIKEYPGTKAAEVGYWELIWYYYQNQRYADAIHYANEGIKKQKLHPGKEARLLYWKGKSELAQKNNKQAKQTFALLRSQWPNSYYGLLLRNPLEERKIENQKILYKPQFWHDAPPQPLGKSIAQLKRYEFLFSIEESEQAAYEVLRGIKKDPKHAHIWKGSELLYQHDELHSLITLIGNYYYYDLYKLSHNNQPLWKFAYPRPYWAYIQKESLKSRLDPYWVLAIIREESHFNPGAVSPANAHGLMQLILPTAKAMAKQKKIRLNSVRALYDPTVNIRLGTHYLGKLAKRFNHQLIFAASGYNAGPRRIKQWLNKSGNLPLDEFVENIPFLETRNYVKRVFKSYQLYKIIYDESI